MQSTDTPRTPERIRCASGDLTFLNFDARDGEVWVTIHSVDGSHKEVILDHESAQQALSDLVDAIDEARYGEVPVRYMLGANQPPLAPEFISPLADWDE